MEQGEMAQVNIPAAVDVASARLPGPGGEKKPFVVAQFFAPPDATSGGEPVLAAAFGLTPETARQLAHRLFHHAAIADHRILRGQLEEVANRLGALQAIADSGDFTNVSTIVAAIRERAEVPKMPGEAAEEDEH